MYFLTVLMIVDGRIKRTRTWGFFATMDFAEYNVRSNSTDLFESGYYNYAVIEYIPPGILTEVGKSQWFRAEHVKGAFHTISDVDKPSIVEEDDGPRMADIG